MGIPDLSSLGIGYPALFTNLSDSQISTRNNAKSIVAGFGGALQYSRLEYWIIPLLQVLFQEKPVIAAVGVVAGQTYELIFFFFEFVVRF